MKDSKQKSAVEATTENQQQWTDLYMRHQMNDTGLYPTSGTQSSSPDVIPAGDKPYSNPEQLIDDSNWNKDFGSSTNASVVNYIYMRGANGNAEEGRSGRVYLYYSPASLLLWPTDPTDPKKGWAKNPLRTDQGAQYVDVSADAGGRFYTPTPFTWVPEPISNDHYCLVARLVTEENPNPIPEIGTLTDFAKYISEHPDMAWRNVTTMNPSDPISTTYVDYSQGQDGGYVYMNLRCINAPNGSAISMSCSSEGPNPAIYIPETTIENPPDSNQFVKTIYTDIPANFRANINYSWYSKGKTPLPGMQFILDPVMPVPSNSPLMRYAKPLEHFGIDTRHLKSAEPRHGIRLGSQTMQTPDQAETSFEAYGKAQASSKSSIYISGLSWLQRSNSVFGNEISSQDIDINNVLDKDVDTQVVNLKGSPIEQPDTGLPPDLVFESDLSNGDKAGDTMVNLMATNLPFGAEIWFKNVDGTVPINVQPSKVNSDPFTVTTFVTLQANYKVKMQACVRLNGVALPESWSLKFEAYVVEESEVPSEAKNESCVTLVNPGPSKGVLLGRVTVKE